MPRATSNRKDGVRKAAARLFRRYSYSGTSMDQVAAEVQLNKGTLYHYYKSKADILYDIVLLPLKSLSEALDQIPDSDLPEVQLRAMMKTMVSQTAVWQDEVAVYFNEQTWIHQVLAPSQLAALRRYEENYGARIDGLVAAVQKGRKGKKLDTTAVRYALVGMVGYVSNWHHQDGRLKVDDVGSAFADLVLNGLLAGTAHQSHETPTAAKPRSSKATAARTPR